MSELKKRYLSPKEVEQVYGIKVGTLANWRLYAKGPKFVKIGRMIRYRVEDLEAFYSTTV